MPPKVKKEEPPDIEEILPAKKGPKGPRLLPEQKEKLEAERLAAKEELAASTGVPLDQLEDDVEIEEEESEGCLSEELLFRNTESFRCLAQVLLSSSSLFRSIEFQFPPIEDPGLDDAFKPDDYEQLEDELGLIKYIDLSKTYHVTPLRRVQTSLGGPIINLKYYGLRKFHMKCLTETLKNNNMVETLILQDNFLSPYMCQMLGGMLVENTTISSISLKNCNIGLEGVMVLNKPFLKTKSLTELDLSFNNIGDRGLKKIEIGLADMPHLRKLSLKRNNLTENCAESLELIILEAKFLEELDLSWNRLGTNECLDIIFNALLTSDIIKILNLSFNGWCTEMNVQRVLTAYLQNTRLLEELDISRNRIPGRLFKEIRRGMLPNQSVRVLNLGYNVVTPEEAFPVAQLIVLSQKLQFLDMSNIFFRKKVKNILLNAKNNGKTLKIGGILGDWEIKGPNMIHLLFKRANFIYKQPKNPKKKLEFGHFLLNLPEDHYKKTEFKELMRKYKYYKLDEELLDAIIDKFWKKDIKRIDVLEMTKAYITLFPNVLIGLARRKSKKSRVSIRSKGSKSKSKTSLSKKSKSSKSSIKGSKASLGKSKGSLKGSKLSTRDSRIMELRSQASLKGIFVDTDSMPDSQKKSKVTLVDQEIGSKEALRGSQENIVQQGSKQDVGTGSRKGSNADAAEQTGEGSRRGSKNENGSRRGSKRGSKNKDSLHVVMEEASAGEA